MTYSDGNSDGFLDELHVGVLHAVARVGTLAVPVWYRRVADGISVITALGSRKGRAISESGRFGLVVSTGYRYVSLEGPVVEVRECDFAHDLVPMAVRYLGDDGERYAALWRDAVGDDLRVFVMRPERRYSADVTGEFAELGIRPLPLP
ncbi:pyridoxamine 5'-phosphate oxidase [Planobispora longispora]|uniref:Pyridoxamine 5'-phosphate oxidase n=1 Tax=Planobispora longispora TaxID=28887 RepID=A0A8J3RIV7_9ACTN|nr:pyridoxamine 5'-phosphate oxidase [Planobispora longispora]BFE86975.1 pyridoxamine 5'-phosphate oxidase family protein [Planobispora longispora]GIH74652.1 pyridoxamine 5'-phosphate oxidase [Planobispora longispora]